MSFRRLNAADAPGKVKRAALSMFTGTQCPLQYAPHARKASTDDRYGSLEQYLPAALDVTAPDVTFVEVEMTESGCAEKVVVRMSTPHLCGQEHVDLVLVILKGGLVKTVWGNVASDKHRSLQRGRLS